MCRRTRSARSARRRGPRAGRPIAPPGILAVLTALPGVRARAAKANAYGSNPPRLDVETMAAVHAS